MTRWVWASGLLLSLAGCNCGGDPHPDAGPGNFITGHRNLFFRLESSELSQPANDLNGLQVLVKSGSGYAPRALVGTGDGGFVVANVGPGEYFVEFGNGFFVATSERDLDLDDHNNLGRPGLDPAFNGNPVSLTLSGMAPTGTPDIVLVTPNTGFYGEAKPDVPPAMPVDMLDHEAGSFTFTFGALPDGTAGDDTWVSQRVMRDGGSPDAGLVSYRSADRFAQVSGLAVTLDGGDVTATFTAPALSSMGASFSSAPYLSHLAEVNPGATVAGFEVNLFPAPYAPSMPTLWAGFSGSLLDYFSGTLPNDGEALQWAYADGYPQEWLRLVSYDVVYNVPAALPGTTVGVSSGFIGDTRPLSELPASLAPRLSPPLAFQVDGQDAFTGADLASLTPTLSWQVPTVGAPTGYLVGVYKLIEAGNTTRRFQAGTIATTQTSVVVPPGLVSPAGQYIFRVTAQLTPGIDLQKHPLAFPTAVDLAVSDVYSGIWNSN